MGGGREGAGSSHEEEREGCSVEGEGRRGKDAALKGRGERRIPP